MGEGGKPLFQHPPSLLTLIFHLQPFLSKDTGKAGVPVQPSLFTTKPQEPAVTQPLLSQDLQECTTRSSWVVTFKQWVSLCSTDSSTL